MPSLTDLLNRASLPASLSDAVRTAAKSAEGDALALLEDLVAIDSFPEDIPGLDAVIDRMEPVWQDLGFSTRVERTHAGLPVLFAERGADPDAPTVLLLIHLDTVFPPGTAGERPFRVDGDRATGPGVADMKGGAVVAWLAVKSAIEASGGLDGLNIRVLNNTDEEAGSVESRPLIEAQAPEVDLALVYEPGRPNGSMVTGRRGIRRYRIHVEGRAAHTGVEPWAGVNAINEAAHKILAIARLNDRERFLSVTPALVDGGSRINIVPERATFAVDVRIPNVDIGDEVHRAIEEIVGQFDVDGATATYEVFADRPPMVAQAAVPAFVDHMVAGAAALGVELPVTTTGGGSDGCFTSALGVPTLDGLGPVGGGYHTRDEFVRLRTIVERAAVSALFLATLGARHD